jgi:hypothetical protein
MQEPSLSEFENRASAGDLAAQLQLASALLDAGQVDAGRRWFRLAAQAGSLEVKLALAENLLAVPPQEVAESIRLTRRRGRQRPGGASARGSGGRRNWRDTQLVQRAPLSEAGRGPG